MAKAPGTKIPAGRTHKYTPSVTPPIAASHIRVRPDRSAASITSVSAVSASRHSATWWSGTPRCVSHSSVPGITATAIALRFPAKSPNKRRPSRKTGIGSNAPRIAGSQAPTSSTKDGDGFPAPSIHATKPIARSQGSRCTSSPPGKRRYGSKVLCLGKCATRLCTERM